MEHLLGGQRRLDDVVGGERRAGADLGEQVAAQQRAGRLLEQHLGLPAVGHVRRRDLAHPLAAEVDHLALGERPGRPVAQVVERHVAAERAVGDLAVRARRRATCSSRRTRRPRRGRSVIQRSDSTGSTVATASATSGNMPARPGVEQQRLVGGDEELVEGEAVGADLGDPGRDPVDAVGDLVDGGLHGFHAPEAFNRAPVPFSQD